MKKRNIIVIGASAGGIDALKQVTWALPADFDASIFIVWHMSPDVRGILPEILNKNGSVKAVTATDKERILPNRIYVAPPDHHLLLQEGIMRVTRGPKENRFRPAVDPLFRSAAFTYGSDVIGVVLSGALDDGSAGLCTIKKYGGIAVVQDPSDAEFPSMPENAIRAVQVDHCLPASAIAALLVRLSAEEIVESKTVGMEDRNKVESEIRIALEEQAIKSYVFETGALTPFTCPECHGVLMALADDGRVRYRCHTGHAYSADSLLASLTETIEASLWSAIRGIEESMMLLNHMGDHFAENNQPRLAAMYFQKSYDAEKRIELVRQAVFKHEQLSLDSIKEQTDKKIE